MNVILSTDTMACMSTPFRFSINYKNLDWQKEKGNLYLVRPSQNDKTELFVSRDIDIYMMR